MAMKPIETRYKGYRFRSRLEARWAVFFDHLGYAWEFEPEGFELSDGRRYLPDFRVEGVFLEVKALAGDMSQFDKPFQLTNDTGLSVICVAGNPAPIVYPVSQTYDGEEGEAYWNDVIFSHAEEKYGPFYWNTGYGDDIFWKSYADKIREPSDSVMNAIYAARSARFEFGQSGADKMYSEEVL
jgi:hypothetical protein